MRQIRLILLSALVPFSFLLTGCGSDGPDGGPDIKLFRTPNKQADSQPVVKENVPLLFPTGKERLWKLSVTAMNKKSTETVRVDAPRTIGGITNATTLTMYQDGKPYRSEMFQIKKDALYLIAAGGTDKMVMSPPMTILRARSPQGVDYKWEGNITFKGSKAPAQAYSRVHSSEEITTPAGKFNAYRVDTSLTTIIEGRPVTFPASRWFVPGVGIVKQTFRVGDAVVEKQLVSYTSS
ncbi:MAG: hypothetical protein H8F28_05645 [Fibrella sp.]|nr:hypothetical protein [Armatimonadota bacterium]